MAPPVLIARSWPRRGSLAAVTLAVVLATSAAVGAEPKSASDPVAELFQRARALHEAGRYAEARELYLEAWRLRPSADLAANLGTAEGALGLHRDAAEHLAYALRFLPASTSAEARQHIQAAYHRVSTQVGVLRFAFAPSTADIELDGARPFLVDGAAYVTPGQHLVLARVLGYDELRQTVIVAAGQTIRVVGTLSPRAAPPPVLVAPPESPHPAPRPSLVPAIVGAGVAVVGLAAGTVLRLHADSRRDDGRRAAASVPDGFGCNLPQYASACAELHDANADAVRSKDWGIASWAVGGVGVAFAAGYLIWRELAPPRSSATSVTVSPLVSADSAGAALSWSGRF